MLVAPTPEGICGRPPAARGRELLLCASRLARRGPGTTEAQPHRDREVLHLLPAHVCRDPGPQPPRRSATPACAGHWPSRDRAAGLRPPVPALLVGPRVSATRGARSPPDRHVLGLACAARACFKSQAEVARVDPAICPKPWVPLCDLRDAVAVHGPRFRSGGLPHCLRGRRQHCFFVGRASLPGRQGPEPHLSKLGRMSTTSDRAWRHVVRPWPCSCHVGQSHRKSSRHGLELPSVACCKPVTTVTAAVVRYGATSCSPFSPELLFRR